MPTFTGTLESPRGEGPSKVVIARGARLGGYRLLAPVAAGGMAYVWSAARSGDYGFERLVAIKVMREELAMDASFRKMFLDEAKLAARIRHGNVVEVIDLGEQGGLVYQVMPLVEGDSLSGLLRGRAMPNAPIALSTALRILADALRGLHAAHETRGDDGAPLQLVHRDVSPQNILVGIDGISRIADFGIAKAVGPFVEETIGDSVKGKVGYMSPEQMTKQPLDRRSDVFAAGVILWELLTGRRLVPAAGATLLTHGALSDPQQVEPRVPPSIAAIAMRALAREPGDRFDSADAMADAIEEAGRACGASMSAKEVGAWAQGLAASTVEERREAQAEAVRTLAVAMARETTPEERKAPRSARATVALVVLSIALALSLAALAVVGVRARAKDEIRPTAIGASEPAAPSLEIARSAAPPSAPSASAPPLPSASTSSSSTTKAPATAPRKPPITRDPAPAHPKYDNPYAR